MKSAVGNRTESIYWLIALTIIGFITYSAGLGIRYYSDDFQFIYYTVSPSVIHWLTHSNPYVAYAYRPIEAAVMVTVQNFFGLNTIPLHLIALATHILLSWLIFVFMVKSGYTRLQAMIASLFMLISEVNAHAVLSNDTLSQVFGAFFGCISLWCLNRFLDLAANPAQEPEGKIDRRPFLFYLLSLATFTLSLLSKETSFGFLLMALGLINIKTARLLKDKRLWGKVLTVAAPFLLMAFIYLQLRSLVGVERPSFGSGEESSFAIGPNIVQNLLLFGYAAVLPASTADVFVAFHQRHWMALVWASTLALVFTGLIAYGIGRSPRTKEMAIYGTFAVMGLFPALLMKHVSELYLYNSMQFLSIIAGVGLGHAWEALKSKKAYRYAMMALTLVFTAQHLDAVRSKALMMEGNGERAAALLPQIAPYAQQVERNGTLFLLNPPTDRHKYSVFLLNGFDVLEFASSRIRYLGKRPDIKVRIVGWEEIKGTKPKPTTVVLTLEGDRVIRYQ